MNRTKFIGLIAISLLALLLLSRLLTTGDINLVSTKNLNTREDTWGAYESGDIKIEYPKTWSVENLNREPLPTGFITPFYLIKPNLSKVPSKPDAPTTNLAMIEVSYKESGKTLETIRNNVYEELGIQIYESNFILEDKLFAKNPAIFIYSDVGAGTGNVTPQKAEYPDYIVLKISTDKILLITIVFFDSKVDEEYTKETIQEIKKILDRFEISEI